MKTKIENQVKNILAKKIAEQLDKAIDKLIDAKVAITLIKADDEELWQYYTMKIELLISDMCNEWTNYQNKAYGIVIDKEEPF